MEGENGQSRIKRVITEGQSLSHCANRRRGPGFSLGDHGGRRFDRDYLTVIWFVVAGASSNVYDAPGITQGGKDQPLNPGVRPAEPRISGADALV